MPGWGYLPVAGEPCRAGGTYRLLVSHAGLRVSHVVRVLVADLGPRLPGSGSHLGRRAWQC